jgi:hypothetical protein
MTSPSILDFSFPLAIQEGQLPKSIIILGVAIVGALIWSLITNSSYSSFVSLISPKGGRWQNKTKVRNDDEFGFSEIIPYRGLPIHQKVNWPRYWKAGKYQLTMGLRKLDVNNWLTFDDQWLPEHQAKLEFLQSPNKHEIVDYLDGVDEAVVELLDMVVEYVTRKYPDMFRLDGEYIEILPTNERYRVKAPYDMHPIELQGLLVMDDLYLLKRGERDLYYL